MPRIGWNKLYSGLARLLSPEQRHPRGGPPKAPRILAIVSNGPNQRLLQSISREAGWPLTLSRTPPGIPFDRQSDVPPIIVYDRALSPYRWREIVGFLTRTSPRPYLILLSPNADANLWDELQRVGGSDILRVPATRDSMLGALNRAWRLWRTQQQLRLPTGCGRLMR